MGCGEGASVAIPWPRNNETDKNRRLCRKLRRTEVAGWPFGEGLFSLHSMQGDIGSAKKWPHDMDIAVWH